VVYLIPHVINNVANADKCTGGFMSYKGVKLIADCGGSSDTVKLLNGEQMLIPEMNFTCNGTVHGVYLTGRVKMPSGVEIYPQLSVWRQVSIAVYQLKSSQPIVINPGTISPQPYYFYSFPSPLPYSPGDVIGISQPLNSVLQLAYEETSDDVPLAYVVYNDNPLLGEDGEPLFITNPNQIVRQQRLLLKLKTSKGIDYYHHHHHYYSVD
jgi:hypothetical protein